MPAAAAAAAADPLCDRYGFFRDSDPKRAGLAVPAEVRARRLRVEGYRAAKWIKMLNAWDRYEARKPAKLKRRFRKGVPDCLRGAVWNLLGGVGALQAAHPGHYEALCARRDTPSQAIHDTIEVDIARTYPKHLFFARLDGAGQAALRRLLHAYSRHDPEVGYCQGVGFLAGLCLMYMPEEAAFWQLAAAMASPTLRLRELYAPGLPGTLRALFVLDGLVARRLPRLHRHLKAEGVEVGLVCQGWVMTLFARDFPFDLVVRAWELFLREGWKAVYRLCLALLRLAAPALLRLEFEGLMEYLRALPARVDGHALAQAAFLPREGGALGLGLGRGRRRAMAGQGGRGKVPLTRAEIAALEEEHARSLAC